MERTALYRAYDRTGRLLYVGITSCAFRRLSQHLSKSDWRFEFSRLDVQWFVSRSEAESAEVRAIQNERPLFNVSFNRGKPSLLPPTPEELDEHEDDELEAMMWEDVERYGWRGLVDRAIAAGKMDPWPT